MPRAENDTWDLASSVGATATMVAAARAVASRADRPVIDDPFAEPLVRAVGVDFFSRLASGDLALTDLDPDGIVRFDDVAPGRYVLHAWHPRLRAGGRGIEREIDVPARDAEPVVVSLRVDAAPPAADRERPVY